MTKENNRRLNETLSIFSKVIILMVFLLPTSCWLISSNSNDDFFNKFIAKHVIERGLVKCTLPDTMKVGSSSRVIVRIKKGTNDIIRNTKREFSYFNGLDKFEILRLERYLNRNTSLDTINISSYAEVELIDPKDEFEIKPLFRHKMKIVDSLGFSIWQWEVSPKNSGKFPLIVNVSTRVHDGVEKNFDEMIVFEKKILVQSNSKKSIKDFFVKYWQWIIGTLIIPIFLWLKNEYTKKIKNRKPKNTIGFKRKYKNEDNK